MIALPAVDQSRLDACEKVIERGLASFVEVGEALLTIRENKLYRASHGTFEGYCQKRWGFTDRRARQLMDAAEIGTMVPVSTERQARELAPLRDQPEALREAWRDVEERTGGKPTATAVREAVERREPQRKQERADVIGLMAEAVTYADRAARAAEQIKRTHLESRRGDIPTWRANLERSIGSLSALAELLEEME